MNEKEMNKMQELKDRVRTLEVMLSVVVQRYENESFYDAVESVVDQYRGYLRERLVNEVREEEE